MASEANAQLPNIIDLRKRRSDMRALWRVCGWGGGAALALTAVAIVSQTEPGGDRLQLAVAEISEPALPAATADAQPRLVERVVERSVATEAKTRRLAAEVHTLTVDRDRLATRLASLERQLSDVTGSIKHRAASVPPAKPAKDAAARTPATSPPRLAPLAMSDITEPATVRPAKLAPQDAEPEADIPLPPVRVVAAPATEAKPEPKPEPQRTEYGVELGGGLTVDLLRLRWVAVKANYGPLLNGLYPVAASDRRPGHSPYRLVLGPLPTVAAAAHLCARFAAMRVTCHPTKFSGENLAQR